MSESTQLIASKIQVLLLIISIIRRLQPGLEIKEVATMSPRS